MNTFRCIGVASAAAALSGCALSGLAPLTFYVLEPGTYKLELNDRAGAATVVSAVPGEALVLELDIPSVEVVSVVPVLAGPGGWLVRMAVTDIPHQYELQISQEVASEHSTPNFCRFARSLTSGGQVQCRLFVLAQASG